MAQKAALRAKAAEFDIVYVYATHDYLLSQFLSPITNTRTDEYGGSLLNRVRLVSELIDETKQAVGDRCAVAVRFSIDDPGKKDGEPVHNELKEMFHIMAEMPDLWDINISDYSYEMGVSRFVKEASLEPYMNFVKSVTTKPVVTVGRFTSPDTMVSQVKRNIIDFIGAARPSIADPFLPNKIQHDQLEDIRECIGCNICYAADGLSVPIRCTQNPTIGEEWRRDWHPEIIQTKGSDSTVLVIGGGPAGLEATRAVGQRGYQVTLADAGAELGGRVTREAQLPGLSEWNRVRDYRLTQINKMINVDVYKHSQLSVEQVLELNCDHVLVATGASWRRDGYGKSSLVPLNLGTSTENLFTPDDIMSGNLPSGKTIVYDDDGYYMASVIAEKLVSIGLEVIFITADDKVSSWSRYTDEQHRVQKRLINMGVEIIIANALVSFDGQQAGFGCVYSDRELVIEIDSLVVVTTRTPNDKLYQELSEKLDHSNDVKSFSLSKIGDCNAPSIIADAVFAGHKWARQLDQTIDSDNQIKYDRVSINK